MKKVLIFLKKIIKKYYLKFLTRPIFNYYGSKYSKRVLVSYVVRPFRQSRMHHTSDIEARSAARIFHELGFQVDIVQYDSRVKVDLSKYDVIYGFGDIFQTYFESGISGIRTIYYATGMHVSHQNTASLQRVQDVYLRRGVWLAKSARFVEKTWSHQTTLSDAIIALGDDVCANSYKPFYKGKVHSLAAPFFKTIEYDRVMRLRHQDAKSHYLWFGSSGLIHKGLDLCLDFFKTRPELTLHICGDILSEHDFVRVYHEELYNYPNIKNHGFIKIDSEEFQKILIKCSFTILPSCSEGGGASIITAIGNGALVPLVSKETSVSTGFEIPIDSFNYQGLEKAVEKSQKLSGRELKYLCEKNAEYVTKNSSIEKYQSNLKFIIENSLLGEFYEN